MIRINTSNLGKLEEFRSLFSGEAVESFSRDLPEPNSDPLTIVRYKASQFENVLVDDVSLDVVGENAGAQIKWLLSQLPNWTGRRASFICLLGIHRRSQVEIFRGEVVGTIVSPRGKSFGFNPYFLPDGSSETLAENKADRFNARYFAVQDFKQSKPYAILEPLKNWDGEFQL